MLNGAFKAFLQQECMNAQLALALLKHPTAMVNTLLESWALYLESSEYKEEKARAQKVDETNSEAVEEKRRRENLKLRTYRLRHQFREAKAIERGQKPITEKNRKFYEDYLQGKLAQDLDESTRAHGYGKLPSTGEMLGTSGFPGLRVGFQ